MMDTRNEVKNADGTYDCEINHPEFGWIPFTASADDSEQIGKDIHAKLKKRRKIPTRVAAPVVITRHDVSREAERRIKAGAVWGGVNFCADMKTMVRLRALIDAFEADDTPAGGIRLMTSAGRSFRLDNARQAKALYRTLYMHINHILTVSTNLQRRKPIPADYENDVYWIANEDDDS